MKPPFKVCWEQVTPTMAREWLKKNSKNRNLRETTVHAFASDMARQAWSENHQAIAFDTGGNLIDGQHRLAAVVKSNVSMCFLVCRDVPTQIAGVKTTVMETIDRGNSRSVADVLKLSHGYKTDANFVTACCVGIAWMGVSHPLTRVRKITVPMVVAIIGRFQKAIAFVSENRPTTRGLRAAPISAAVAFAHAVAPQKAEEFYKQLTTGIGLSATSPVLVLRNHIINGNVVARGSKRERLELEELVLHTLYCVINRKEMARVPRVIELAGARWFRDQQPQNLAFLESLFPSLEASAGNPCLVNGKTFKLTPAAESLLRGKAISDRLNSRLATTGARS